MQSCESSESVESSQNLEAASEKITPAEQSQNVIDPKMVEARLVEVEKSLQAAQAKAEEYLDHYRRAMADIENIRRRAVKEKEEMVKLALIGAVADLLPIIDHFAMGLKVVEKHDNVTNGFQLVYEQLLKYLEQKHVQTLQADGAPFDPNRHECVAHVPSDDVPENHVIQIVRSGYVLGDKLIRPATVTVSSGPMRAATEVKE